VSAIGQVIGSYRLVRELGVGGMGAVYQAEHVVIGRQAALKILHAELSGSPEMVTRIFNEARAAALIRHPGLVDVYDFGRLPDGRAFLVMELLEGETLSDLLGRGRPPLELALSVARQLAAAVGAAHERGIVHRDLKPDNVFIVRDDAVEQGVRARVLDFGIAKLAPGLAGGALHTRTGSIMGTPVYMSPEQCRGAGDVDWRCDVYALGCILFEMVAGRRVFEHEGIGELLGAHLHSAPPSASAVAPGTPRWLDAVIRKALAKEPGERWQSMVELGAALGGRRRATGVPGAQGERRVPRLLSTFSRGSGEVVHGGTGRTGRRWLATAGGLLALAVVAALWRGQHRGPTPASAPRPAVVAVPVPLAPRVVAPAGVPTAAAGATPATLVAVPAVAASVVVVPAVAASAGTAAPSAPAVAAPDGLPLDAIFRALVELDRKGDTDSVGHPKPRPRPPAKTAARHETLDPFGAAP
jgi:serine/threonine-protein kinase